MHSRISLAESICCCHWSTCCRQQASSKGLFGLIVWGLDSFASYGYPAGGNARKTSEIVIKP